MGTPSPASGLSDAWRRTLAILGIFLSCVLGVLFWQYDHHDHPDSAPPKSALYDLNVSHGAELCDVPIIISAERKLSNEFHTRLKLQSILEADRPRAVAEGEVQAAVVPIGTALVAYANDIPIRIIAGSGMNRLYLIERVHPPQQKIKVGTTHSPNLDIFAHEAVAADKRPNAGVEYVYFDNQIQLLNAFRSRKLDLMVTMEPGVSQAVKVPEARISARAQQLWHEPYPGCVLITSDTSFRKYRSQLFGLVAGLLKAQRAMEVDLPGAVDSVQAYLNPKEEASQYKPEDRIASIDIRDQKEFILERGKSLQRIRTIAKAPGEGIFDFRLLDDIQREHAELLSALRQKERER